jgi:hypothetical protein
VALADDRGQLVDTLLAVPRLSVSPRHGPAAIPAEGYVEEAVDHDDLAADVKDGTAPLYDLAEEPTFEPA